MTALSGAAPDGSTRTSSSRGALLAEADLLKIPWERILSEEIRAERALRDYLDEVDGDWPLWSVFWIMPRSLLSSWRVRQRIHELSWEAVASRADGALRQLRTLHAHLCGRNGKGGSQGGGALQQTKHLFFGYQRVLLLQRICRAAAKSRGDRGARVAFVLEQTGCSVADAEWSVERETSREGTHRLDDAMRRTRNEGYELPTAKSEVRAFQSLRQRVRSGTQRLRKSSRRRSEPS